MLFLPVLFLLVAGQLGVFLALSVPLGQVPDETSHVMRADSLRHGEILAHRELIPAADDQLHPQQGVDADPALQIVGQAKTLSQADWDRAKAQPWSGPAFTPIGTIASYWPVFYAPAAAGIELAKAAGASPFNAFRVARMANLLTFLLLGTAALLLARRGQALLFCTLSVPMTLHLAASVSQDGLIIAASALASALLTRPGRIGFRPEPIWRDLPRLGATLLLGSIAMAKPPYLPLAGVLLLPFPQWRHRRVWLERLGLGALVTAATLAWVAVTLHSVATPGIRMPAEAGPLWPGPRPAVFPGMDVGAQLRVLLAKPTRFLKLPWRSQLHDRQVWPEAIGVLGYLNVLLPRWLYWLWGLSLVAATLAGMVGRRIGAVVLPWRQAAWPLLCLAATWLGIYLSQYLTWTPIGNALIDGAQGRYFLPLVPILALALPSLPNIPALQAALTTLPVAACLAGAAAVPLVIIRFYYLH